MINPANSACPRSGLAGQDAYTLGVAYLHHLQPLLPNAAMIDVLENLRDRTLICTWIGTHISTINQILRRHLETCHDCFYLPDRRPVQIFAVPLSQSFGLDGICNLSTTPTTILIDTGRVAVTDWLKIVAHEYAHAHVGTPGHHPHFAAILAHLCLGLGLESQPDQQEETLRRAPLYRSIVNPLAFWCGEIETSLLDTDLNQRGSID